MGFATIPVNSMQTGFRFIPLTVLEHGRPTLRGFNGICCIDG